MSNGNDEAEEQVDAFLQILHSRYGISESDVSGLLLQLVRLQKRTEFARRMGEWFARSIITVLVTAFFSGLAWAIVHFIGEVKNQ